MVIPYLELSYKISMTEAYVRLLAAMENDELEKYLCANLKYRVCPRDPNLDTMNDYNAVAIALNEYGKNNKGFAQYLSDKIKKVLENPLAYHVYSICQILFYQTLLERNGKNSIRFVDDDILTMLKEDIIRFKEYFEKEKEFEGTYKKDGLYTILSEQCDIITKNTGISKLQDR